MSKHIHPLSMEEFPDEVIIEILSWLPVKSLLKFKTVSKQWKASISDPSFVQLHLAHSIQDYNNYSLIMSKDSDLFHLHRPKNLQSPKICSVLRYDSLLKYAQIISSCNGLVCLAYELSVFILNPSTRELTRLPEAPTFERPGYGEYSSSSHRWSFGYSPSTQEYKVVKCGYLSAVVSFNADGSLDDTPSTMPDKIKEIMVHTVGTDSWRTVEEIINDDLKYPGVYLNGALHWPKNFGPDVIISFDVGSEVYVYMHTPMFEGFGDCFLGVLRGMLSVSCRQYSGSLAVEIWVMTDYGVEESWVHQLTIEMDEEYYFKPLWWLEDGLLIKASYGDLFIYDPKTEEFCVISNLRHAVVFVESLVSLKSNEKVRKSMLEAVEERPMDFFMDCNDARTGITFWGSTVQRRRPDWYPVPNGYHFVG